jgi:membrane protease YdiL (CAAX protease family)
VSVIAPGGLIFVWYGSFGHHGIYDFAAALSILGEISLLAGTLHFARPIKDATFGWGAALGWTRPTRKDLTSGALWGLANFGVRLVVGAVLVGLIPRHILHDGSNTSGLHRFGPVGLVLVGIGAVLVAPIAEETLFRGVLLRAGMVRWRFPLAALVSSVLFGALHGYEAASLSGAGVLILVSTVFGLVQCLAARRTGRLVPCAVSHGLINALALLLALTN